MSIYRYHPDKQFVRIFSTAAGLELISLVKDRSSGEIMLSQEKIPWSEIGVEEVRFYVGGEGVKR